ncbi:FAD/NAD(P)-binding protein [Janthinobacterium sp. GB4P2]|uniref:FAD/NAD(P)-binding protein n=1 Tax=Janthinobacterium sp. GB4P2 TaxID=3424189 RepID=UPI003F218835
MKSIVIIGAGFSGVALVSQLVRQAGTAPLRIVLVNRSGSMARGLAYGTRSADHVLNVPAGNMSAVAEDSNHFLNFARSQDPSVQAHSFVLRRVYGDYLESMLKSAEQSLQSNLSLERITGEVESIETALGGQRITLVNGHVIEADKVVLAFGHFASPHPGAAATPFFAGHRYVRDPWSMAALDAIPHDAPVLLVGTGLSAIDVCMTLMNAAPARQIHMVSRRGLLPKAHRSGPPRRSSHALPEIFNAQGASLRQLFKAFRRHVRAIEAKDEDWREALNLLRPGTHILWQGWSDAERRRFLRHVQPYWDNHRHRAAPQPHGRFEEAVKAGQIQVHAGRIATFTEKNEGVSVLLRLRGSGAQRSLDAAYVVNCIGPDCDLRKTDSPLVKRLLMDGVIQPDRLGLGVAVDEECRVLSADGTKSVDMYYIGPLLRAQYWEATAVPELRKFASRLGAILLRAT